jgi:hypothetical protein
MLAENLVDAHTPAEKISAEHHMSIQCKDIDGDIINEPKEANVGGLRDVILKLQVEIT